MSAPRTLRLSIIGDVTSLERGLKRAEKATGAFEAGLATLRTGALLAAAAIGAAFVANVHAGAQALMRLERIGAQTNAVVKSTGGIAGVTATQVADLAASMQRKTGIDEEAIRQGQNMLLTFTQIRNTAGEGNNVFTQTTKIMADMSVALGKQAPQAARMLGMALQNPIQGVTRLMRAGVVFTDAQKEQIRALTEAGRHMDAQKIILRELEVQFGGVAEAVGKTLPGQIAILGHMWADIQEKLASTVIPTLMRVVTTITENWPQIERVTGTVIRAFSAVVAEGRNILISFGSVMLALRWKAVTEFVAGMVLATKALWAKVVAARAAKVGMIKLLGLTGPKGWLLLAGAVAASAAAIGIFNRMTAAATAGLTGAALGNDALGKAGQGAAEGQELLGEALTAAGKAASKNILSFDQVHTLQEEMAKTAMPGMPEFAAPALPAGMGGLRTALAETEEQMETLATSFEQAAPPVGTLGRAWEGLKATAGTVTARLKSAWEDAKTNLGEQWATIREWAAERWGAVVAAVNSARDAVPSLQAAFGNAKTALGEQWATIRTWAVERWGAVTTAIATATDNVRIAVGTGWDTIISRLRARWTAIQGAASEQWEAINENIRLKVLDLSGWLGRRWAAIQSALGTVWTAIQGAASEQWARIRDTVVGHVNGIVGAINNLIAAYNRIPLAPNLPMVGTISTGASAPAGGGMGGLRTAERSTANQALINQLQADIARVSAGVGNPATEAWFARHHRGIQHYLDSQREKLQDARLTPFAKGGIVTSPTRALIGEAGPEAVIPLRRGNAGIDAIADAVGNAVLYAMREALRATNAGQGDSREIILEVDGARLGRVILPALRNEGYRTGVVAT